ncbi:hypothetical protein GGI35DRAFT_99244 [Trichoderma velutinum]
MADEVVVPTVSQAHLVREGGRSFRARGSSAPSRLRQVSYPQQAVADNMIISAANDVSDNQTESNQTIILGTVLALQTTIHERIANQDERIANQQEKIVIQNEKIAIQNEKIAIQNEKYQALVTTIEEQNNQHLLAMNDMRYTANILQGLSETVRQQGLANTACLNRMHDAISSILNAIDTAANTQLGVLDRIIRNQDFMLDKIIYTENELTSWIYEDAVPFSDDTSGNDNGSQ